MPRTPRKSPRKAGRPRKVAEVGAVLERAQRTGESIEEAAKVAGVAPSTVHAHKSRARKVVGVASPAAPPPSSPPDPPSPPAGSQAAASAPALPQGGAVSGRPDLLELVRRILEARNAPARAELDAGLAVHVAGGEPALLAWLARPIAAVEIDRDELETLREGLGVALAVARTADAGGPQLRALGIVDRLAKSVSVVSTRRPHIDGPDEVTRRLVAVRDQAVERIGVITSEEAADFARDRADLEAWLETLGPVGGEAVRRLGAMLDGAAA